ncbi:MAG: AIPR family protein [Burkholderiales bacterium]|nr:AIPR family protein [Burkholderiales bacterium]
MAQTIEEFHAALMAEIEADAVARGEHTRTVLVEELATRLVVGQEIQGWEPAYHDGKGSRSRNIGVDGYSVDEVALDGTLHVLIAELASPETVESIGATGVRAALSRASYFVEDAISGRLTELLEPSTPAADFANQVEGIWERIKTVRIHLLTNALLGQRFREVDVNSIKGVAVELNVWDLERFYQMAQTGGREVVDIDLIEFAPEGLPALPASIGDTGYQSYLCVVPGRLLADIYERYGSRLLEGNVRAFLTARGNVNKGIRTTIMHRPDRFFAFNNGITATATGVDFVEDGGSCRLRRVSDLQIVNGGQTTASLFNTRRNDRASLAQVFVQMKLSVLPVEVAEDMIPEISRYANTQNSVSAADLFANHPFHRRVEELSRRLVAPPRHGSLQPTHWFYERARSQYQTEQLKLTEGGKRQFLAKNPRDQVITKTDLAKYENSWAMLPHKVSAGAQKNFVEYASAVREQYRNRPDDFNDRWFQHMVVKAILFKACEKLVSKATWYPGGYRANIVTYGVARLAKLVADGYPGQVLDLDRIWRLQRMPDAVADQLELCAAAACRAIIDPQSNIRNITEWAKREQCWREACRQSVPALPALEAWLKPADDEAAEQQQARKEAKEQSAAEAEVEVVTLAEAGYWRRLYDHPKTQGLLSGIEHDILRKAALQLGWVPSDAQARKLLAARARLEEEGVR